ncbi:MAG: FmdE family protein [Candidatus Krumholzibacteriota bacterium]
MNYPKFYDTIETIKLQDNLSAFLGSLEGGLVEFSYLDVVKAAGHSCPTVAGAYLMTLAGLKALYKDETPIRGEILVSFKETAAEGVAGVIGNVITQITGATTTSGFKGIGGNFARHGLMEFEADINAGVRFKRLDTGATVDVTYDPGGIPGHPRQQEIMQRLMQGVATPEDKAGFGTMWQQRVEAIFSDIDKVITVAENE